MAIIGGSTPTYQSFTEEMKDAAFNMCVGLFGIPVGTSFLTEISNYMTQTEGATIDSLYQVVLNSSVGSASSYYPSYLTDAQFAERLANNLLGTSGTIVTADAWTAGKDWALSALQGGMSRAAVAKMTVDAVAAVDATDASYGAARTMMDNKVTVAEYYTYTKGGSSTDIVVLADVLETVTNDAATVTAAQTSIDTGGTGSVTTGQTYTLTTNADEFSPNAAGSYQTTSYDDTFNAGSGRMGSDDSVDGGLGNDVLNVTISTAAAPIIKNIETINITTRGNASAFDFTDISGYTTLNVSGTQSGTLGGFSANPTVTLTNGFGNNIAVALADASGTADAVTFVSNGASAFTLNVTGIETVNLVASGGLTLGNTGNASQIGLGSANLNISGDGDVTLYFGTAGGVDASITGLSAINATALAGNLSVTMPVSNKVTINAGTGNDSFNLGSGLDTLDVINGGAGTDAVNARIDAGLSTVRPTLTDVETLSFDGFSTAATVDLRNATALTTLNFKGTAAATITQLSKSVTQINLQSAAAAPNVDVTYATNSVSDVTLFIGAGGTAAAGVTVGDVDFQSNSGSLVIDSSGISANVIDDLSANEVAGLTINVGKSLGLGDIGADAADSFAINAAGDFSAQSASLLSASTVNVSATGTANVNIDSIVLGDGASTVTINTLGDFGLSALSLSTGATSVALNVNVTIGSGSTAYMNVLTTATISSALSAMNFTLAGSGNVDLAFSSAYTGVSVINIDALSLGGVLDLGASAVQTGLSFSVTLGNGGTGSIITLGQLADTVIGGSGADQIEGGAGNDQMMGGAGNDVFLYQGTAGTAASTTANSLSALGQHGVDVITDFSTADTLRFADLTAITLLTAVTGSVTSVGANTSLLSSWGLTAATAVSAGYAIAYQRGSDVVVQVLLASGSALTTGGTNYASGDFLEIVLQGETLNSATWTAATAAAGGVYLANIVVS